MPYRVITSLISYEKSKGSKIRKKNFQFLLSPDQLGNQNYANKNQYCHRHHHPHYVPRVGFIFWTHLFPFRACHASMSFEYVSRLYACFCKKSSGECCQVRQLLSGMISPPPILLSLVQTRQPRIHPLPLRLWR